MSNATRQSSRATAQDGSRGHWTKTVVHPPCDCFGCNDYLSNDAQNCFFMTYEGFLTNQEAAAKISNLIKGIKEDREYLQTQCGLHWQHIEASWKNMSAMERQKVLEELGDEVYPDSWPDVRQRYDPGMRKYDHVTGPVQAERKKKYLRQYRVTKLLPHITHEDLRTEPLKFLCLLYNRTRYSPQQWAAYDNEKLQYPWETGTLDIYHSRLCVVMEGEGYGKVTEWHSDSVHKGKIMGYPRASLLLEGQREHMRVLRSITAQLTKGLSTAHLPVGVDNIRIDYQPIGSDEIASPFVNRLFSAPLVFQINNLLSIAQMQLDAATDHSHMLQTDPRYMKRYIGITVDGEPTARRRVSSKYVHGIAAYCILHDIENRGLWEGIVDLVKDLQLLESGPEDSTERLGKGLCALEQLLRHEIARHSADLQFCMPQRPGFNHLWHFDYSVPGQVERCGRNKYHANDGDWYRYDPLDWCIWEITSSLTEKGNFDKPMLFDYLRTYMASAPQKERSRMDEILYAKFSDHAALLEMLEMISLRRPRFQKTTLQEATRNGTGRAWKNVAKPINTYNWTLNADETLRTALKAVADIPYPEGPVNAAWIGREDALRNAQDNFWKVVRKQRKFELRKLEFEPADIKSDQGWLSAGLGTSHLNEVKANRNRLFLRIAAEEAAAKIARAQPAKTRFTSKRAKAPPKAPKSNGTKKMPIISSEKTSNPLEPPIKVLPLGQKDVECENVNATSSSVPQNVPMSPEKNATSDIKPKYEKQTHWGHNEESIRLPRYAFKSEKVKTRGAPSELISALTLSQPPVSEADILPTLQVSKDALNTFQQVFSSHDEALSELAWSSFVSAMIEAHFKALCNGGSAVKFEAEAESMCLGSIVFHGPHPESKIDPITTVCHGKRLTWTFGLTRDSFVLR